jgi:hypothetical protein
MDCGLVPGRGLAAMLLIPQIGTNLATNCDNPDNYKDQDLTMTPMTPSCGATQSNPRHSLALRAGRSLPVRNTPVLLSLLAALLLVVVGSAQAVTYNSNGSAGDIQLKHNGAANGDTITIPAGTFTWSVQLNITKAITLQGSGIGNTIIKDAGSASLITWNLVAGKPSRMTGIEFRDGGRTVLDWGVQSFGSNTNGSTMRIDHCKFDHLKGFAITPNDTIGVIDHNTILFSSSNIPIYPFHKNWNNQGPLAGGSWHDSSHFGTSQFLFIEDNVITADSPAAAFDCYGGARIVFRYNTCTRVHCEIHGTECGIYRGGRAFEIYNNTFVGPTAGDYIINGRSGIFVVHDNQSTGISGAKLQLVNYRAPQFDAPWGQADGTSPWDVNLPGGPFYSGIATSGTSNGGAYGFPTVTVSGSPWTVNQWKGYSIKKTSAEVSPQKGSYILGNTTNTITFLPSVNFANMSFSNGNTFQLYKVVHGMDQPGRAEGSLIPQVSTPALPNGWNDQITDPCYEWNNSKTEGGSIHFASSPYDTLIRANEHYFDSTVKPGYTPYPHPHPLTTGSTQPNPPVNLRIAGP